MNSLLAKIQDLDQAFVLWRVQPDSIWLHANLAQLRQLAELQSAQALDLAKQCGVEPLKGPP